MADATELCGWADTAADRLIVPGYSRIGYALRRRCWPADPAPDILTGATALVTGANSGLGEATAAGLARLGARVHMLVRDRERGERARSRIMADAHLPAHRVRVEVCDIGELAAVREFAADFRVRVPRLDVLVHNAGVMPGARIETAEGNELALATHVLGPHLLTGLLTDSLRAAAPARVIWVSSGSMYAEHLPTDNPQYARPPYRGATAYARTKRMQVVLAEQWAHRLDGRDVAVHAMHPGWADTSGVATAMPRFYRVTKPLLRTPVQGADTIVWLAAAAEPGRSTGRFWHDRRPRPTHYRRATHDTAAERDLLWRICQRLISPTPATVDTDG